MRPEASETQICSGKLTLVAEGELDCGIEKPDLGNEPRGKGVRIWEVF